MNKIRAYKTDLSLGHLPRTNIIYVLLTPSDQHTHFFHLVTLVKPRHEPKRCLQCKGTCCQARETQFNPQDPYVGRRITTPGSCALTPFVLWHTHAHTNNYKAKNKVVQAGNRSGSRTVLQRPEKRKSRRPSTSVWCKNEDKGTRFLLWNITKCSRPTVLKLSTIHSFQDQL